MTFALRFTLAVSLCVSVALSVAAAGCDEDAPTATAGEATAALAQSSQQAEKPTPPGVQKPPAQPTAPGQPAELGKPAPDFTLPDIDGASHTLSALEARPWCSSGSTRIARS